MPNKTRRSTISHSSPRQPACTRAVDGVGVGPAARQHGEGVGRQTGHEAQHPDHRHHADGGDVELARPAQQRQRGGTAALLLPAATEDDAAHDARDQHQRLGGRQERLGGVLERRVEMDVVDDEDHHRQPAHEAEGDVTAGRNRARTGASGALGQARAGTGTTGPGGRAGGQDRRSAADARPRRCAPGPPALAPRGTVRRRRSSGVPVPAGPSPSRRRARGHRRGRRPCRAARAPAQPAPDLRSGRRG